MIVTREFGNPDNDLGEWYTYMEDEKTGEKVEALVRMIPAPLENKIQAVHKSDRLTIRSVPRSDQTETDIDMERQRRIARDRAAFALLDTRGGYERGVGDEEASDKLSRLAGEIVPKGGVLCMDGKWGKPELKGHVLTEDADFTGWVCQIVDNAKKRRQARAVALQGNS
jgi:hypothetical protein